MFFKLNKNKKILPIILCFIISLASCSQSGEGSPAASDIDRDSSLSPDNPSLITDLGVTYDGTTVNFKIWAPNAERVSVKIYELSGSTKETVTLTRSEESNEGGIWKGSVTGSANEYHNTLYDLKFEDLTVLDPYAKAMACFIGSGTGRGAIVNLDDTDPANFSDAYTINNYTTRDNAIIYEVHVRDFTSQSGLSLSGKTMGTYDAFTEKISHLQSLGVTHIQLLPVLNYYYGDERLSARAYESGESTSGNNYNWGYDPHNYFTPEGMYATDPETPSARIAELKTLIKAIHDAGMGVILDVVYNHTAVTSTFSPIAGETYFYRTTTSANSGCGNDVESSNKMVRKLIVDSLTYWVSEYHVDGFRFDLMGILDDKTITDGYDSANNAYHTMKGATDIDVLFVGEGWQMWNGPSTDTQGNSIGPADQTWVDESGIDFVSVFSDDIRDIFKGGGMNESHPGWLGGYSENPSDLLANIKGQPSSNFTVDEPGDCVNYFTAHDGLCLYDKMCYSLPGVADSQIFARIKAGYVSLLTSQGIAFIHGGDEMGRTKEISSSQNETESSGGRYFVRNSYDSTDQINHINWSLDSNQSDLLDYVTGLIAIRNSSDAFSLGTTTLVNSKVSLVDSSTGTHAIAYKCTSSDASETFYVFINLNSSSYAFTIPTLSGLTVEVLADNDEADASGVGTASGFTPTPTSGITTSITLNAYTSVILKAY